MIDLKYRVYLMKMFCHLAPCTNENFRMFKRLNTLCQLTYKDADTRIPGMYCVLNVIKKLAQFHVDTSQH